MKWKLGNAAGIGIYVHWTFWLLPAWIMLSAGGGLGGALSSVIFVFAIFGCVVLHELGHALMARHFNIDTRDITLYPIGGIASLERIPKQPAKELAIALAGPAVNVVIAAGLFLLLLGFGIGTQGLFFEYRGGSFLVNLMFVNVALVVFNMLPAFPMDGGRVLRAFLAMQLPYVRATEIAVRVGHVAAFVLGLLGLFVFHSATLLLVALFVLLAAQAELSQVRHNAIMRSPVIDTPASWPQQPRNRVLHGTVLPSRTVTPHDRTVAPADSGIVWLTPDEAEQSGLIQIVRVWP